MPIKTLYGEVKIKVQPGTQHLDKLKLSNYVSSFSLQGPGQAAAQPELQGRSHCDTKSTNSEKSYPGAARGHGGIREGGVLNRIVSD